ncbi:vWA domain-containing protein [Holdemania filiformis]|uniref:vWA domain-containing protein n=1 Tax=Holdemania filiformis TaxID=61171 RepID=UPI0024320322|nr:vWA domain-containing protein [Holdemania filiformis]
MKKIMKETMEIVFILDRSGSMAGLEQDTIGGFNGLIEKQKQEASSARVSLILFDDRTEVILDRVPIEDIGSLSEEEYYVRGSTALWDAVGRSVLHIARVHQKMKAENRPEKTLFIITTDGMENSSVEYSLDQVKQLIERQKERDHWEFLFLGANIDAVQTAGSMGIGASRAVNFHADKPGMRKNFGILAKAMKLYEESEELDENWAEDIRKDFESRKQEDRFSK